MKMQAVLYTLAEKFLQKEDLENIKEEIHMTRLGQMIFDDGEKKGRENGLELAKQILAWQEKRSCTGNRQTALCYRRRG